MKKITLNLLPATVGITILCWAALLGSAQREKPEVIFPHSDHVEVMGMECEICHPGVAESRSGVDDHLPSKHGCAGCHDVEDTARCTLCHSSPDQPRSFARITGYSPKFNHAVHIEKEVSCAHCHGAVAKSDSSSTEHLPGMQACMGCHDGMQAQKDCILCHETAGGKIPVDHVSPLWVRQHGDDASLDDGQSCMVCHARNDCQECHQGDNLLPRVHPVGFQFKHAIEIRTGRSECAACHEQRSFCIECHTERNVYPLSHQRGSWATSLPGRGGRHAVQARINIELCAACHSDEPDSDPVCAACHANQ